MEELLKQIKKAAESMLRDATAQEKKGNKAAGLRARKASLALEPMLKEFRTTPSISEDPTISWVRASTAACCRTSKPKADNLPSRKPAALFTFASLRLMLVWSQVKFGQFSV